jgi:hypothetical protein
LLGDLDAGDIDNPMAAFIPPACARP